jgi:hypothetical protein
MSKHPQIRFGNNKKTYKDAYYREVEFSPHKPQSKSKTYDKHLERAIKTKDFHNLVRIEEEH